MHQVERAGPERVPALAALLGRAFADDPMFVWPFGSARTAERAEGFFRAFDERLAELGWLWAMPDDAGAAAWIPPGNDAVLTDLDRELQPAVAAITDDGGVRVDTMLAWIADHFPEEPFWYLDHIGVAAERRGDGLGTALIEHGLALAARDGVPAFLETARPRNVAYYERRGFRTTADGDVPGGGPHIWFMRSDP
jgi:ribosomal protein S18 acetylase RimI-like enzyme